MNPLFNWNVKELFLYLTAEYATKDNVRTYWTVGFYYID